MVFFQQSCFLSQGDSKPESTKEKKEETEAEENKDDKKDSTSLPMA